MVPRVVQKDARIYVVVTPRKGSISDSGPSRSRSRPIIQWLSLSYGLTTMKYVRTLCGITAWTKTGNFPAMAGQTALASDEQTDMPKAAANQILVSLNLGEKF